MQMRYVLAVIGALLPTLSQPAQAQSSRRVGEWTIHDSADGPGCQVRLTNAPSVTSIDDMAYLLMSYEPQNRAVVLIAGRRAWNLTPGQTYPLSLRFDNGGPTRVDLQAGRIGKEVSLFGRGAMLEGLLEPMARARNLSLDPGDGRAVNLKLDGGAEAMAALRACQRRAGEQPPQASSPQPPPAYAPPAGSPPPRTRKADPFAD
jgi:hypothetical protein